MKVRIQGNSIRLRLTQTEVANFGREGVCSSHVDFPGGKQLTYRLVKAASIDATFSEDIITIALPQDEADHWANTDQVGVRGNLTLENEDKLSILVEKDFKCLTERAEDESDMFPNPQESH